jgi:hypothetical protein
MVVHVKNSFRRSAIAALSLLFALFCPASDASAQALCSEPISPACVELDLTYDDDSAIARCEDDLRRFGEDLDEYVACIDRRVQELEDLNEETLREFSCRRAGDCP